MRTLRPLNPDEKKHGGARGRRKDWIIVSLLLLLAAFAATAILFIILNGGGGKGRRGREARTDGGSAASVCFIDLGQGDSALIEAGGAYVLIDTGEEENADALVRRLKQRGVARIDVLVGTHPHSDHIGGLDIIIDTFDIGDVFMPAVTNNTVKFEKVLKALERKGLGVTAPKPGDALSLPGGLTLCFLGPIVEDGRNLNNSSIVLKAVFAPTGADGAGDAAAASGADVGGAGADGVGEVAAAGAGADMGGAGDAAAVGADVARAGDVAAAAVAFLFTGDAELDAERLLLGSGADLSADVLKVGHHGSATSTCDDFCAAVNPIYAVIECGKGNPYGHPDADVLNTLAAHGATTFRTDVSGSITFTVEPDGAGRLALSVTTEKGVY